MIKNIITLGDIGNICAEDNIPWYVTIELLTKCNLDCIHCYLDDKSNEGLKYEHIIRLMDELKEMGTFNVTLTGGEIFLRDDIIDIIKGFRNRGMRVNLLSNATLISDKIIDELKNLHISLFSTTIFSIDENVNDQITRKKGSLTTILNVIEKLKQRGVNIEVKMPIMKQNVDGYDELKEFCKSKNYIFFPSVSITRKLNGDITPLAYRLDDIKYAEFIRKISGTFENEKYKIGDGNYDNDPICPAIRSSSYIDSKGDVFPCNSFFYKVGNIHECSFNKIWRDSKELKLLKNLKKKDMKNCMKCELVDKCTICPGDSLADGDMLGCSANQKLCAMAIKNML